MNIDDGIRSIFDFLKLHIAVITLKEEHVLKKAILILLCVLLLPVAYSLYVNDSGVFYVRFQ